MVHLFPFAVPCVRLGDERLCCTQTAAHAAPSLFPPPAALGLVILLRCPAVAAPDEAGLHLADRCHSLASFLPPQAAVGSLPIPNTEVKHMYADNTWRATLLLRCPAAAAPDEAGLHLADRCHSLASFLPPQAAVGSLPREDR